MLKSPSVLIEFIILSLLVLTISCSNTAYVSNDSVSDTSDPECLKILKELSRHMHRVEIDSFQTDNPIYTFRFDVLTDRGKQMEAAYWTNLINWSNQLNNNPDCMEKITKNNIMSILGEPTFSDNTLMYHFNFGENCPCIRCETDNIYRYLGDCELLKFSFNKEGKMTNAFIFLTGSQFSD